MWSGKCPRFNSFSLETSSRELSLLLCGFLLAILNQIVYFYPISSMFILLKWNVSPQPKKQSPYLLVLSSGWSVYSNQHCYFLVVSGKSVRKKPWYENPPNSVYLTDDAFYHIYVYYCKTAIKKKGFKSVLGFGHTVFTEGGLEILSLRHDIRQFGYSDHFWTSLQVVILHFAFFFFLVRGCYFSIMRLLLSEYL